jgi:hypothetical protein
MPLPIVPFLVGMLGRAALGAGVRGSLGRLGLASIATATGKSLPAPVVGSLVRDFTAVSKSLVDLPSRMNRFGEALVEGQSRLTQYSGGLAAAYAELEGARTKREMELARKTTKTGVELAKAENRLEKAMQPWKTEMQNLENWLGAQFLNGTATILEGLNGVVFAIKEQKQEPDPLLNQLALNIAAGKPGAELDVGKRQQPPKPKLE